MSEESFWRAGGFTGYAQVVLTVVALLSGLFVYTSWRYQETAKRNSAIAIQILKNVDVFVSCLEEARSNLYLMEGENVERELANKIATDGPRKIDACREAKGALRTDLVVAKTVLGFGIASTLLDIIDTQKWIELSQAHVELVASSDYLWNRRDKKKLLESLRQSGLRLIPKDEAEREKSFGQEDAISRNLKVYRQNLESQLNPFLRMY